MEHLNQLSIDKFKGTNSPMAVFPEYVQMNPYYTKDEYGNYQKSLKKSLWPREWLQTITNPLYNTQFEHKDYTKNFNVTDNFSLNSLYVKTCGWMPSSPLTKGYLQRRDIQVYESLRIWGGKNDVPLLEREPTTKASVTPSNWNTNASINYNLTKDKHLLSMFARWEIG